MSPYIFVLCMERLSHAIRMKENYWKPIKFVRYGLAISHIFFADDLMLFPSADLC